MAFFHKSAFNLYVIICTAIIGAVFCFVFIQVNRSLCHYKANSERCYADYTFLKTAGIPLAVGLGMAGALFLLKRYSKAAPLKNK